MRNRSVLSAAAGVTVAVIGLGAPIAAHASSANQSLCHVTAESPTVDGSTVRGTGGRHGCFNTVVLTVKLMEDRTAFPDEELARASRSVDVGSITVSDTENCDHDPTFDAYTQANASDGARTRSSNTGVACN